MWTSDKKGISHSFFGDVMNKARSCIFKPTKPLIRKGYDLATIVDSLRHDLITEKYGYSAGTTSN